MVALVGDGRKIPFFPQGVCHSGHKLDAPVGDSWLPRINDHFLETICFLYPDRAAANSHQRLGGTGFFVGRKVRGLKADDGSEFYVPYVISNLHVVSHARCSVIRINRRDGVPVGFDFPPTRWVPHPTEDLAGICLQGYLRNVDAHEIMFIPWDLFLTRRRIEKWSVGIGDEVFMIGRFLNHQGVRLNRSAVRFGNISMMPEGLWNSAIAKHEESFAVEMRSRTGFSGSPVFVYRTPLTNISNHGRDVDPFYALLGVNWGYVNDKETGENSWLNGVVPAWRILELFETPALQDAHLAAEEDVKKATMDGNEQWGTMLAVATGNEPVGTVSPLRGKTNADGTETAAATNIVESDPPANDANPNHRGDFMRLVDVAGRKPEPKD